MFKVFPKGYDPMVAAGPPPEVAILLGITWTEEETAAARELEKKYTVEENAPVGLWSQKI